MPGGRAGARGTFTNNSQKVCIGQALAAARVRLEIVVRGGRVAKWSIAQIVVELGGLCQIELREPTGQILAREPPGEGVRRVVVAVFVGQQPVLDRGQVGKVVGGQDLTLDDREIDLDLVEPGGVGR